MFQKFQCSLASALSTIAVSVESECKDTTFFQTTKFFFRFQPQFSFKQLIFSTNYFRFFSSTAQRTGRKNPKLRQKSGIFWGEIDFKIIGIRANRFHSVIYASHLFSRN